MTGRRVVAARSGEVVESLLLDTKRESEGISHWHFPSAILQIPANRAHVRNQKLALCVVILVIALSSRKQEEPCTFQRGLARNSNRAPGSNA